MDLPAKRPRVHEPWPASIMETLAKAEYDSPEFQEAHQYLTWRLEGLKPYHTDTVSVGFGNGYYWLVNMWLVKVDDLRYASITCDTDESDYHVVSLHAKRDDAYRAARARTRTEDRVLPPTDEDLAKAFRVPLRTASDWTEGAWKLLFDRDANQPPPNVALWLRGDGRGACLVDEEDPEDPTWTKIGYIFGDLASASHTAMMHEIHDLSERGKCTVLVFPIEADKAELKQAILACLDEACTPTEAQIDLVNALLNAEGSTP
jgi:hypothetical protein